MRLELVSNREASAVPGLPLGETPDLLVAEANHRIANSLALIAGMVRSRAGEVARRGRPLSAAEARLMLADVSSRIHLVGQLHRLLAQGGEGEAIDLHDYLGGVAAATVEAMAEPGQVRLIAERGEPCALSAERALPLGVIVGELVTNAVKYAHPAQVRGVVEVGCEPQPDGSLVVWVADDGVGLAEGFDPASSQAMGLRMIRGLAERLGAVLAFESADAGLTVRLSLPANRGARP